MTHKQPIRFTAFNRKAVIILAVLCLSLTVLWLCFPQKGLITKEATTEIKVEKMADGSLITLNKESSISYSQYYNKAARTLLLNGEAYFKVAPNKNKPFVVKAGKVRVEAIGTAFNIHHWPDSGNVLVQVYEGVVKIYLDKQVTLINKGQSATFEKNASRFCVHE